MHEHVCLPFRFLSSPSLPIPTASDLVQLIENIQAKLDVQVLTGNEVFWNLFIHMFLCIFTLNIM